MQPDLHAIDPSSQYETEVRTSLAAGEKRTMTGADLLKLQVTIDDAPGSALLFYRQK